jgi:hypothetical protein
VLSLILLVEPLVLGLAAPSVATPIHIDFEAPADCPSREAFYEAVHSRLDRIRLAGEGEASLVIRVRLTRVGTKINGELRIAGDEGGETRRHVDGERCAQVMDALALTTVIALDRVVNSPEAPATEPPPAPPPPAPPTPDRASRAAVPSPAAARPALHVQLGARALVAAVVSPYVNVGGEVFVRLARDGDGPTLDLALAHARNDLFAPASGVAVLWTAIELSACAPGWSIASDFRVRPCALGSGGWLDTTDESLDHPSPVLRSWWSLGGLVRASASLGRGFAVELEGGINVPLVRRRYVANNPDRFLGETPILSVFGAFGVAYRF